MKEKTVLRLQHVSAVYTDGEKSSEKCLSILFHSYLAEQCEYSNPTAVEDCFFHSGEKATSVSIL